PRDEVPRRAVDRRVSARAVALPNVVEARVLRDLAAKAHALRGCGLVDDEPGPRAVGAFDGPGPEGGGHTDLMQFVSAARGEPRLRDELRTVERRHLRADVVLAVGEEED